MCMSVWWRPLTHVCGSGELKLPIVAARMAHSTLARNIASSSPTIANAANSQLATISRLIPVITAHCEIPINYNLVSKQNPLPLPPTITASLKDTAGGTATKGSTTTVVTAIKPSYVERDMGMVSFTVHPRFTPPTARTTNRQVNELVRAVEWGRGGLDWYLESVKGPGGTGGVDVKDAGPVMPGSVEEVSEATRDARRRLASEAGDYPHRLPPFRCHPSAATLPLPPFCCFPSPSVHTVCVPPQAAWLRVRNWFSNQVEEIEKSWEFWGGGLKEPEIPSPDASDLTVCPAHVTLDTHPIALLAAITVLPIDEVARGFDPTVESLESLGSYMFNHGTFERGDIVRMCSWRQICREGLGLEEVKLQDRNDDIATTADLIDNPRANPNPYKGYVPQVGDVVYYFPTLHADFLDRTNLLTPVTGTILPPRLFVDVWNFGAKGVLPGVVACTVAAVQHGFMSDYQRIHLYPMLEGIVGALMEDEVSRPSERRGWAERSFVSVRHALSSQRPTLRFAHAAPPPGPRCHTV